MSDFLRPPSILDPAFHHEGVSPPPRKRVGKIHSIKDTQHVEKISEGSSHAEKNTGASKQQPDEGTHADTKEPPRKEIPLYGIHDGVLPDPGTDYEPGDILEAEA